MPGSKREIKRVLFVCMGNICRSPTAEGVVRARVKERGLAERIAVASAGTIAYHVGEAPDARMRKAAQKRGYTLDGAAQHFRPADFDRHDLVVAMDRSNHADMLGAAGVSEHPRLKLFSDFLPDRSPVDVPDPYYGGAAGFERVLDICEQGADGVIDLLLGDEQR